MEPDALGLRCDSTSCSQFDFLSIKCHCNKVFCRDHISPDNHSCPLLDGPAEGQTVPFVKRQRCALGDCQKLSLQSASSEAGVEMNPPSPASCLKCSLSFCVEYVFLDLHIKETQLPQSSSPRFAFMYWFAGAGTRQEETRSRPPCAPFFKSVYTYSCCRPTHNQAFYRP